MNATLHTDDIGERQQSHSACLDWLSPILADVTTQLPLPALRDFVAKLGLTGYDKLAKLSDPHRSRRSGADYLSRLFVQIEGTTDYAEVVRIKVSRLLRIR